MKQMLKYSMAFIALTTVIYCAGAFIHASFSIKEWHELTRVMVAVIWLVVICMIFDQYDNNKKP